MIKKLRLNTIRFNLFYLFFLIGFIGCKSSIQFPEGGYPYPDSIDSNDSTFIFYPLRDSLSTSDSFITAYEAGKYLQSFNEPNLSIRPQDKIVFRLIWDPVFSSPVSICLTEDQIIVKEGLRGHPIPLQDSKKFTVVENMFYNLLSSRYPILENSKYKPGSFLDSMVKVYPQLLKADYYKYLKDKASYYKNGAFEYRTRVIPVSRNTITQFVNQINASDFWNMSFRLKDYYSCGGELVVFELNTPEKYKVVYGDNTPELTATFATACNEIIKLTGLENKIKIATNPILAESIPTDPPLVARETVIQNVAPEELDTRQKEDDFKDAVTSVVHHLAFRDSARLSKYIEPKSGVYILYRIGLSDNYSNFKTLRFSNNRYPLAPFYDSVQNGELEFSALPSFDCATNKWSKMGWIVDTSRVDHLLSATSVSMNKVIKNSNSTKKIDELRKLENNSRRVVITSDSGNELIIYLTYINKKWKLTIIDKLTCDCSA